MRGVETRGRRGEIRGAEEGLLCAPSPLQPTSKRLPLHLCLHPQRNRSYPHLLTQLSGVVVLQVSNVSSAFPDIPRENIMYDLSKTKSAQVTVEKLLTTGFLPPVRYLSFMWSFLVCRRKAGWTERPCSN